MTNKKVAAPSIHPESGQILILTAVAMVALLGIAALSLDASYMYDLRNRMHAAADAAAKSAAIEVVRNPTILQTDLEKFADQQVQWHGFAPSRLGGTTSVVVNHGPVIGPNFIGNPHYVEVIVSETKSTFFANILGFASMTPSAMAIAGAGNPSACMVVNHDLTLGNSGGPGGTTLTMNGCGVAVGGNIIADNPGASVSGTPTPSVAATGVCVDPWDACSDMGIFTAGAPTPTDPLSTLVFPSNPGGCIAGVAATLSPGCYTSIASTVTTLQSGSYYVTGTVDIDNLTGSGVTIFLSGAGHLQASNNKAIHLTAPTSGAYTGVAIFQDRTDSNNFDTGNNFTIDVSGAIYMPGSSVNFPNSLSFTGTNCTLFVASSLSIRNGAGTMSNSGCAAVYGGALFLSVSIAQ